jgi:hypothetical protein
MAAELAYLRGVETELLLVGVGPSERALAIAMKPSTETLIE